MAIIVDKEEKRRTIALACKALLIENGIHELTIAKLAKTAGIGKGTFYEYFNSKEELLFELVGILMAAYDKETVIRLESAVDIQEKIKIFASFFYGEESAELRKLYKLFVGISLTHPQEEIRQFQTACFDGYFSWFEKILQEGITQGELAAESAHFARGLFATAKGLYIVSETTYAIPNLEQELNSYIDMILALLRTGEKQ